jgi:hypothetical protein
VCDFSYHKHEEVQVTTSADEYDTNQVQKAVNLAVGTQHLTFTIIQIIKTTSTSILKPFYAHSQNWKM